jgi:hypothetical protein
MNKFGLLLALSTVAATFVSLASAGGAPPVVLKQGNNFKLETGAANECKATQECVVAVTLTAGTGFHVNKEYPYKFKAGDIAGVDYTSNDSAGKNVFSKASGDFVPDAGNEKVGVLKVHFKAAKAGPLSITGTFKLSVCSAENCQLETAELAIPVAIK